MKTLASFMTRSFRKWNAPLLAIVAVIAMTMSCSGAFAQSGAGSIQGTVTDSTGAVIQGATISVVNTATNSNTDTTSSSVGFYTVPALFTGSYTITVTAPGMKTYKTSLQLLVAQNAVINPVMTAGAVTQQVEVSADFAQLTTTENGTIASTLESARINQLPMNGRTLITMVGQTTPGLEGNGSRANGLMGEALEYVADGVPITNRQFGGMNLGQTQVPDPDSVQEVRAETTNTGAQYSEPGTVIVTTKSGTNSLHGALFETARNNAIGIAKNRNNRADFKAPHLVRNEFGASAGGPVIIPHLYHGKDKTFWFYAYERYSFASPTTISAVVPTVAMRAGDFSGYTNASGVFQQLYDPQTTHSDPNCNGAGQNDYCRAPFLNNQIPLSRLSPTWKMIQDITPLPTNSQNPMTATNTGGGVISGGNISVANPTFNTVPTQTFRIDHEFNEDNRAYLRYTSNILSSVSLRNYTNQSMNNNATIAADGFPEYATGIAYNPSASFAAAIGYTHVFSPTFFSETIISQQALGQHNYAGGTPKANFEKQLGTPNNFGEGGFPSIGSGGLISGLWGYGGTQFIYGLSAIVDNADQNFTLTRGKHQFQFGGRYRHERFGQLPDWGSDVISYNGQDTAIIDPASTALNPVANTGGQDADAFLGAANSYSVTQEPPYAHFHDMEFDAYFQDNFHVSRNLTLNLGVRWESHPATWVKYGMYNSFDLKNDAMVLAATPAKLIEQGLTTQTIIQNMLNNGAKYETPEQAGVPSSLMKNYHFNFSPRIGMAYQPFGGRHGTVIRGAYGRYIYPMPTRSFIKNPIANNPLVASYNRNFTSGNQTNDGKTNELLRYPQGSGQWQQSSPFTPIMGTNSTGVVDSSTTNSILPGVGLWSNSAAMPPDFVTQMNFTIEQPLKGNSAVRVTWLWSHGTNLDHYYYNNNAPSKFLWQLNTDTAVNTANGSIATRPYDTKTWGNNTWDVKDGWSNDNALQATYQRLFHNGFSYQINYVWSAPFRLGGNYFRDGTVYPAANFLGTAPVATGTSYTPSMGAGTNWVGGGTVTTPASLPAAPAGTLPWQEYHDLVKFEQYKVDTAIPKQHITFNGVYDMPFGRGKKYLAGVNTLLNEVVGGWEIAGAGQFVSQSFSPNAANWGRANPIKYYKSEVVDCQSKCQKAKLWFNGYIAPTDGAMGNISGLPNGYVKNQAASPAYMSPINFTGTTGAGGTKITGTNNNVDINGPTPFANTAFEPAPSNFGTNPYSKTVLNGPNNWNVDLSVFKVFPITEKTFVRFNVDAFNAFNIMGYQNPNTTTGLIAYEGDGKSSSYWTPRQIQMTLRLQF